jgi:hypothetical protein
MPWVNTIAADRQGNAMYADVSVVPDVDAAHMARCCAQPAGRSTARAGRPDRAGRQQERLRLEARPCLRCARPDACQRMPVAIRSDWVQNSNDSFFYSNPQQSWSGISPMVGDDIVRRPRTRSSLIELPELVARGPVTAAGRAGAALQQPQPDGARRAARSAGRLRRRRPHARGQGRLRRAARLGPPEQPGFARRAPRAQQPGQSVLTRCPNRGLRIDYGTSYVQTVTFDSRARWRPADLARAPTRLAARHRPDEAVLGQAVARCPSADDVASKGAAADSTLSPRTGPRGAPSWRVRGLTGLAAARGCGLRSAGGWTSAPSGRWALPLMPMAWHALAAVRPGPARPGGPAR